MYSVEDMLEFQRCVPSHKLNDLDIRVDNIKELRDKEKVSSSAYSYLLCVVSRAGY